MTRKLFVLLAGASALALSLATPGAALGAPGQTQARKPPTKHGKRAHRRHRRHRHRTHGLRTGAVTRPTPPPTPPPPPPPRPTPPVPASGGLVTVAVGTPPLSDATAAALVQRSTWEPRPDNAQANHRPPTADELAFFRANSDMPYKNYISGQFTGTTDEIMQWAAYKWGLSPDLLRAAATVESWWHMSAVGDNGDSFGLFQMRRPYHCCYPLSQQSSPFNADYYGGLIRSYYDGLQPWLNTVPESRPYAAGDIWGSVGAWGSGRWYNDHANSYIALVQQRLAERTWLTPNFLY